ncbi:beta-N-acetylhexosaminidase [Neobacillus sp. MM2021_6]|uniref:beta-N-acetylhexosaminidase n=1 Tax=Bacillaceae TaxID=186817 RepID=UPI0014086485|nr:MULTISPECIES: beta-N-acetylhexosaminidase [Bacillaceae]MBO0958766.1 beta-N-acetylhexosaminidase [Neobacillus sp. MM2021_6]NHC18140.1 beta-N-acetylhexosaminidase [Bacillus sp. MM2020_4]
MKLHLTGEIAAVADGLQLVMESIGIQLSPDGYPVEVRKQNGPIRVVNQSGRGQIYFKKTVHFFRAVGLWMEHFQTETEFDVTEVPQFDMCGVMLDASRNAVPTTAEVENLLRRMAVMGLDTLMLYTEDTYEVKEHPYFGYMRGSYAAEELTSLDDYAAKLGVEMIPCIQTLGHLREALKWNYASDIRDTDDILLVEEPKTYEFLENCIKAASEPFRTKRIHIGMDETFQLGLGKYLQQHGYENHIDLMNRHLQEVVAITERHGLKPMIWSDMYFPLFAEDSKYKDENGKIPEEIIAQIPDVELVYWNYYSQDQEVYEKDFHRHMLLGKTPIFAGGAWTWNGMAPNYGKAIVTTEAAIAACKKEGIKEVFVTMWGDNGAETPFSTSLPILQLFAEHTYHQEVTLEQVAKRFEFCGEGHFDDFMMLKWLDETPGVMKDNMNTSMTSKVLLYQDILIGLYDENIRGLSLGEHYQKLVPELEKAKKHNPGWASLFGFYEQLARVLSEKAEIGLRLTEAYKEKDYQQMKLILGKLDVIQTNVDLLRQQHREVWFAAYKPFGWEVIDIRYGGVITRIDSVKYRINEWLDGRMTSLEELEEKRLRHDGPWEVVDGLVGGNVYHRIVTAGNFSL